MNAETDSAIFALRRAKRQALGLLLLVTAVFIATSVVERGLLLNCVKAMAEAAMVGALEVVQDAQVERFIHKAARALIGQVDMSRALAAVLDTLTHNGRHQALLDDVLAKLIELLQNEQTRTWVAQSIVAWLKKDHPRTEKLLPSDWLGDKGSALLARALESLMADVAANPQHALRAQFDAAGQRFIERRRSDPEWERKGEEIRTWLQTDATVAGYVQTLWLDLRGALQRDLA